MSKGQENKRYRAYFREMGMDPDNLPETPPRMLTMIPSASITHAERQRIRTETRQEWIKDYEEVFLPFQIALAEVFQILRTVNELTAIWASNRMSFQSLLYYLDLPTSPNSLPSELVRKMAILETALGKIGFTDAESQQEFSKLFEQCRAVYRAMQSAIKGKDNGDALMETLLTYTEDPDRLRQFLERAEVGKSGRQPEDGYILLANLFKYSRQQNGGKSPKIEADLEWALNHIDNKRRECKVLLPSWEAAQNWLLEYQHKPREASDLRAKLIRRYGRIVIDIGL